MAKKIKLLLVEDDINLGFLTSEFLEQEGFDVKLCKDGESGLKAFKEYQFHLCILDVMLPKMDGFALAKNIRAQNTDVPFIFLTARGVKEDKQTGFELGADDYLTKPFDEEELLWRIIAILNRTSGKDKLPEVEVVQLGKFEFQVSNQQLCFQDINTRLTERETKVLYELYKNKGNIIKREQLLESIWGENDYFAGRSLDVFITKLRKYLKPDPDISIENVPRVGFILNT